MASIWKDINAAMNNEVYSNSFDVFRFMWQFVTFDAETQDEGEIRWRRLGAANAVSSGGIFNFMCVGDPLWSPPIRVGRWEDKTTWTIVGGELVPPAAVDRRYSNITSVEFPVGFFSPGVYAVQARMRTTGTADWTGWVTHRFEISEYDDRQQFASSSVGQTKGPAFQSEGQYAVRVEVVSSVGTSAVSTGQTFNVWETNKYLKDGAGVVQAVPENRYSSESGVIGRVTRR